MTYTFLYVRMDGSRPTDWWCEGTFSLMNDTKCFPKLLFSLGSFFVWAVCWGVFACFVLHVFGLGFLFFFFLSSFFEKLVGRLDDLYLFLSFFHLFFVPVLSRLPLRTHSYSLIHGLLNM